MEDEIIVRLFLERSEQAVAELSRKYGTAMMKLALNVLGDRRDAEECVNDACMAVWNAIPPAKPDSLRAFTLRIVRNLAVSRWRGRGFRHRRTGCEVCLEELEGILSDRGTPEDAVNEKQLTAFIEEFLDDQSEVNRIIFVRRFWYMEAYDEIARAVGLRAGAVRTRLSRLRKELKTFLIGKGVEV